MNYKYNPTICGNHQDIIDECTKQIKFLSKTNEFNIEELIQSFSFIKDMAKEAKKQGQIMENRMREYRNSIEKLGFVRKQKKVKNKS